MTGPIQIAASERTILDVVRRNPGITRAALTSHSALSQQSVHRMVDALSTRGLVELRDGVAVGRGKPSPGVVLNPQALLGFGVSVNTDEIQIALASLDCQPVAQVPVETDPTDPARALSDIAAALDGLLAVHGFDRQKVVGLGFSISGFRTGEPGAVVPPEPLEHWSNRDLRPLVKAAIGGPVWLENNATAGAIGEAMVGAGLEHDTFAYLSLNYGFGSGIVVGGAALRGGFGNAGELGSLFSPEKMAHRPALGELMRRLRARGVAVTKISELSRNYDPNWPGLEAWLDEVAPQLNQTIRAIRAIVDPTAIVIGGEAPYDLRQRLAARAEVLRLDRYGAPIPGPSVLVSETRADPAAFGAALIPLKERVLV